MVARAVAAVAGRFGLDSAGVLNRLSGPFGSQVRAAAMELGGLDAPTQKRTRAEWTALARTPVPAGIRSIHPSWLEISLHGLPQRARAAVASSGLGAPVDVWLARWATARLVAMPAVRATSRPTAVHEVGTLEGAEAQRWLERVGADQFAYALSPTGTQLPERLRDAADRIRMQPRFGQLGPLRMAIERCQRYPGDLLAVGASAVAPHLSPDVRRQLVSRMPYAVGVKVWHALEDGAAAPLDHSPTWTALAAD